jgi:branched-chain amino acid transport system substrate-binding protein
LLAHGFHIRHPRLPWRALSCALLALVACTVAACGDSGETASDGGTVTIPYLGSSTGPAAGFKQDIQVPPRLATMELERSPRPGMPKVKFERLEDGLDPARAVKNFREAMKSDPIAVLGVTSNTSAAIAPLAKAEKVPFIATGASKVSIAADNRPWVYTPWADPAQVQGTAVKQWLELEPEVKRVVMVQNEQEAASKTQGDAAAGGLEAAGAELVGKVAFNTSTTDFAPLVTRAASYKPDGIIVASTPPQASAIDQAIRKQGIEASVYQIQNSIAEGFFTTIGDAAEGYYGGTTFYADASTPSVKEYVTEFEKLSGGVRPTYSQIYDGFRFLLAALEKADIAGKSTDEARDAVRLALDEVCITAVIGRKECFNDQGYIEQPPILLRFGKDGKATIAKGGAE